VVAAYYNAAARAESARTSLAEAESDLADAAQAVVASSGQDRAVTLLGLSKAELRRVLNRARQE
jgi:hypothetical protein